MVTNQRYEDCKHILERAHAYPQEEVAAAADYMYAFNDGYQAALKSTLTQN